MIEQNVSWQHRPVLVVWTHQNTHPGSRLTDVDFLTWLVWRLGRHLVLHSLCRETSTYNNNKQSTTIARLLHSLCRETSTYNKNKLVLHSLCRETSTYNNNKLVLHSLCRETSTYNKNKQSTTKACLFQQNSKIQRSTPLLIFLSFIFRLVSWGNKLAICQFLSLLNIINCYYVRLYANIVLLLVIL